jgi:hypothetical protein
MRSVSSSLEAQMQKRKAVKLLRRVMHILAQAKQARAPASFLLLEVPCCPWQLRNMTLAMQPADVVQDVLCRMLCPWVRNAVLQTACSRSNRRSGRC